MNKTPIEDCVRIWQESFRNEAPSARVLAFGNALQQAAYDHFAAELAGAYERIRVLECQLQRQSVGGAADDRARRERIDQSGPSCS